MKIRIGFLLGLSLLVIASSAHAQAPQTWVSGVGSDDNPCIRTAPCRTFAHTISVTNPGGEITVLDPGDFRAVPPVTPVDVFGPFTIDRSITINGNSIGEIIPGNGENGVTVNVTIPGDPGIVILRGLTINGVRNHGTPFPPPPPPPPLPETGGSNGIQFQAGGMLVIDHCTIHGFKQNGVEVSAASGNLVVGNTTLTDNTVGIHLTIATALNTLAQVTNSLIAGNTVYGVHADGKGTVSIANSLLTNNGVAVRAESDATVRLSNNDIFDNGTGIGCVAGGARPVASGTVASADNNRKAPDGPCRPNARITVQ